MARVVFEAAVLDQEAYLDGVREYTIEGASAPGHGDWRLTLTFRRPKEPDEPLDEADLTLSSSDDDHLFATLGDGRATAALDDETGETIELAIEFNISAGEGRYAGASGTVTLTGEVTGATATLTATIEAHSEAPDGS
jgi:hypothetical protein